MSFELRGAFGIILDFRAENLLFWDEDEYFVPIQY